MGHPPGQDDLDELLESGFRYALSLTHDVAEAEDVLQDGWVALLRAKGPKVRGYLFRSIRSRFIDRFRHGQLVVVESLAPEELQAVAVEDGAEDAVVFALDFEHIGNALGELRSEEREALFLSVVEGYSATEIAELTATPRGSVLSLIHRAKKKLAKSARHLEARA